ncbi:hypothetical protein ACFL5O_03815 [Myxococcota bacterium]
MNVRLLAPWVDVTASALGDEAAADSLRASRRAVLPEWLLVRAELHGLRNDWLASVPVGPGATGLG